MPILCIKGDICRILQGGLHFTSSYIFIYIYSPLCLAAFLSPNILNCPTLIPEGDCLGHSLCLNWYSMRETGREIKQKILFETFFFYFKMLEQFYQRPHPAHNRILGPSRHTLPFGYVSHFPDSYSVRLTSCV